MRNELRNIKRCSNHEFSAGAIGKFLDGKILTQKQSRGHTIWKVMRRNAWNDGANWQRKKPNICTQSLLFAGRPSLHKGRTGDGRIIVQSVLTHYPENAYSTFFGP